MVSQFENLVYFTDCINSN